MQLDNRVTFKFDQNKPRKYGNIEPAAARYEEMSGKPYWKEVKVKRKDGTLRTVRVKANKKSSIHHLDGDRENDHPLNMFICNNDKEHNELHNQLQQFGTECIKSGILGFDWKDKKYFAAWKPLADWIRRWREKGEPNWHQNEGLRSKDKSFLVQMHQSLFEQTTPKNAAS